MKASSLLTSCELHRQLQRPLMHLMRTDAPIAVGAHGYEASELVTCDVSHAVQAGRISQTGL